MKGSLLLCGKDWRTRLAIGIVSLLSLSIYNLWLWGSRVPMPKAQYQPNSFLKFLNEIEIIFSVSLCQ